MREIVAIRAREIIDSRGNPTKVSSDGFMVTGAINVAGKPNLRVTEVSFGLAAYDELLPTNGWSRVEGNSYVYQRPEGHVGPLESMEIDFDAGTWRARGGEIELGSLPSNPTTDVRIEIGDFGAIYRARFVPKGNGFKY